MVPSPMSPPQGVPEWGGQVLPLMCVGVHTRVEASLSLAVFLSLSLSLSLSL